MTLAIPPNLPLTRNSPSLDTFSSILNALSIHTRQTSWGRQIEDPSICWVISEWPSVAALDAVLASPEYKSEFVARLVALLGHAPSAIYRCWLNNRWQLIQPSEGQRAEIVLAYFPASITGDTCEAVDALRSIHAEGSFTATEAMQRLRLIQESRGWVEDVVLWQGEERRVYVVVREWVSEEREGLHKAEERLWDEHGRPLVVDAFEKGLRENGMVGLHGGHGVFRRCQGRCPSPPRERRRWRRVTVED